MPISVQPEQNLVFVSGHGSPVLAFWRERAKTRSEKSTVEILSVFAKVTPKSATVNITAKALQGPKCLTGIRRAYII